MWALLIHICIILYYAIEALQPCALQGHVFLPSEIKSARYVHSCLELAYLIKTSTNNLAGSRWFLNLLLVRHPGLVWQNIQEPMVGRGKHSSPVAHNHYTIVLYYNLYITITVAKLLTYACLYSR